MQPELERGDDSEVASAPPQAPEQLGMLVGARPNASAIRGDDLRGDKVVAGQAMLAHEPAVAASQCETSDACRGHDATDGGQPMALGRGVDVLPRGPGADHDKAPLDVDPRGAHCGQIEHEAIRADRVARDVVAPALDGDQQIAIAGETERGDDVVDTAAPHDHRGAPVDHAVPDHPRVVVTRVAGGEQYARKAFAQLPEIALTELDVAPAQSGNVTHRSRALARTSVWPHPRNKPGSREQRTSETLSMARHDDEAPGRTTRTHLIVALGRRLRRVSFRPRTSAILCFEHDGIGREPCPPRAVLSTADPQRPALSPAHRSPDRPCRSSRGGRRDLR